MKHGFCTYCSARGDLALCPCGSGSVLGCAEKLTCPSCTASHRKVFAPLFKLLLKTAPATRSNSPRTKLLGILHESIVYRRSSIRQAEFCLTSLRKTSPFDSDAGNFRGQVLAVAQSLELNQDIAGTLKDKIVEAAAVRVVEQFEIFLRESSEKEKLNNALARFVEATGVLSRDGEASRRGSCVREAPRSADFYR